MKQTADALGMAMAEMLSKMGMLHPAPSLCHNCKYPLETLSVDCRRCPVCMAQFQLTNTGSHLLLYHPYTPMYLMDASKEGYEVMHDGKVYASYTDWLESRKRSYLEKVAERFRTEADNDEDPLDI